MGPHHHESYKMVNNLFEKLEVFNHEQMIINFHKSDFEGPCRKTGSGDTRT